MMPVKDNWLPVKVFFNKCILFYTGHIDGKYNVNVWHSRIYDNLPAIAKDF